MKQHVFNKTLLVLTVLLLGNLNIRAQEPYGILSGDGNTLTLYSDNSWELFEAPFIWVLGRQCGIYYNTDNTIELSYDQYDETEQWEKAKHIKTVVIDPSLARTDVDITSTARWFAGFLDLTDIVGMENLRTEQVTDMSGMFAGCRSLDYLNVSSLNTQKVKDMSSMFAGCEKLQGLDINTFRTDSLENMSNIFGEIGYRNPEYWGTEYLSCSSMEWINMGINMTKVKDMSHMFRGCRSLMSSPIHFAEPSPFHNDSIRNDSIRNMSYMFAGCSMLESLDLSGFNTANVIDMSGMFTGFSSLKSLDLSGFNTDSVMNMSYMFSDCNSLTSLDLSNFNTANVTDMKYMFARCQSLESIDLGSFNTANVTDMSGMFQSCYSLKSLDLTNFNTSSVREMLVMFNACTALEELDLRSFDTSEVYSMWCMFSGCQSLTSLDVSSFNTSKVSNMIMMFYRCSSLASLDVSNFNTSSVRTRSGNSGGISQMFGYCSKLKSLDLSNFNLERVTDISYLFQECDSISELDLSSFNTTNVTNMEGLFSGCDTLQTVYVGSGWSTSSVSKGANMFKDCPFLVGGQGTKYDSTHTDYTYARIDCGSEAPGYFTDKTASGIKSITNNTDPLHAPIYNLRGQRLTAPQKGVNIIGGKKIVLK